MKKIKNVVLLTVDCLSHNYLQLGGNFVNACPNINSLSHKGIYFSNARSHGFPSQMSFPSILSSTLPLDYGGYDLGIKGRPVTLAEVLRNKGLHTIGYSTSPWLGYFFGYNRGFDEFYELFDLNKFWGIFSTIYYKYYKEQFNSGIISKNHFYKIIKNILIKYLKEMYRLCKDKKSELSNYTVPYHTLLYRHDFNSLQKHINSMFDKISNNGNAEIPFSEISHLTTQQLSHSSFYKYVIKILDRILRLFWFQIRRSEYSVPAPYIGKLVRQAIKKKGEPFFIWSHFLDIHDGVYSPDLIGFPPNFSTLFAQKIFNKKAHGTLHGNCCLQFIDNEIGKILETMQSCGILDSTLLVISGDHGVPAKCPDRKAGSLFDEMVRVPLIFYNPTLEHRIIAEPCGLLDIAPTVLYLLGQKSHPGFKGRVLLKEVVGDYSVVLESLGPGPGDFKFKNIKISIIRGKYKLIWEEAKNGAKYSKKHNYFFDLERDPQETMNLYLDCNYTKIVSELETIAIQRCEKLRKELLITENSYDF